MSTEKRKAGRSKITLFCWHDDGELSLDFEDLWSPFIYKYISLGEKIGFKGSGESEIIDVSDLSWKFLQNRKLSVYQIYGSKFDTVLTSGLEYFQMMEQKV